MSDENQNISSDLEDSARKERQLASDARDAGKRIKDHRDKNKQNENDAKGGSAGKDAGAGADNNKKGSGDDKKKKDGDDKKKGDSGKKGNNQGPKSGKPDGKGLKPGNSPGKNLKNAAKNAAAGGGSGTPSLIGNKGENAAKGAKIAAKGFKKAAVAILSNPVGRIAVFIVIICLAFSILVSSLPSIIWNLMFHVDDKIDPIKDTKIEEELKDTDMEAKEEEWAEIISSHLTDSHDAVYDRIKEQCAKDGVDFEATKGTIVDSTDFLGRDQAKGMDTQYQCEQALYDKLKKKGYTPTAALSVMAASVYLTKADPTYGLNIEGSKYETDSLTSKRTDSTSEAGMLKFPAGSFEKYILKQNPELKNKPSKLKDKMCEINVQADYFDYLVKEKMGKKGRKDFIKQTDLSLAIKTLQSNLTQLDGSNYKSLSSIAKTLKSKHLIGSQKAASGDATGQRIVDYALQFADKTPMYRYKLDGPNNYEITTKPGHGIQCAGFVSVILDHFGLNSWGVAKDTATLKRGLEKANAKKVDKNNMQPGDIVFFNNKSNTRIEHVGIYAGNNKLVSASSPETGITQRPLSYHSTNCNPPRHISYVYRIAKNTNKTVETDSAASGNTDNSAATSNPAAERAKKKLSELQAKSNYPAKEIKTLKPEIEKQYKAHKDVIDKSYKIIIDAGISPAAAAGMLGNAWQESHWNPEAVSNDGFDSYGVFQLTGSRQADMKVWIPKQGGKIKSTEWQTKYVVHEIKDKDGSQHNAFYRYGVTYHTLDKYMYDFYKTDVLDSYEKFASCDDILQTTINYCASCERPEYGARPGASANLPARYAAAEVILEKCGGITGDGSSGDPSNTGAGSRQMATILSAFSVKEDQLYPMEAEMKAQEKDQENAEKIVDFFSWLDEKTGTKGYGVGETVGMFVAGKYTEFKQYQRHPDPKGDLEKLLKDGGDKLYDVEYGDIIEDDEGKKIYASVEIRPATSDTIIKSVFKMDPTATYETEDGKLLADKDTTVEDAVTTLTDNHMEMLYGNHDYGGGVSGDTGSGEVGSPLPPGKPINVVSPFGYRFHPVDHVWKGHEGADLECPSGTTVYAANNGKVKIARWYYGYGNCVCIEGEGKETRYGHLHSFLVSEGDTVKRGDPIAISDNTGKSTGPHLHFEVRINGQPVDPIPMLKKQS